MSVPTMTVWTVTYLDHYVSPGSTSAIKADVYAAYYAPEGCLVEFKDAEHQVVKAFHADILRTITRTDAAKPDEASA